MQVILIIKEPFNSMMDFNYLHGYKEIPTRSNLKIYFQLINLIPLNLDKKINFLLLPTECNKKKNQLI